MSVSAWRRLLICLVVLASSAASSGAAAAADRSIPPAARRLYREGYAHYHVGHFDKALASFERAARLVPHPTILLALAQCHRQLRQLRKALFFYRLYQSKVHEKARYKDVQEQIARLERRLATRAAAARREQHRRLRAAAAQRAGRETAKAAQPRRRSTGWLVSGIATSALAVAAEISALALTARANQEFDGTSTYGSLRSGVIAAHTVAGVAAAAAVVSWVLYARSGATREASTRVAAAPLVGGGVIVHAGVSF